MRFDGNNDDRPDRAVYTAVCLSTRRVVLGDLSRDLALATPDATGRRALGPNACRRTVELTSETPLLPLRHVSRSVTYAKTCSADRATSMLFVIGAITSQPTAHEPPAARISRSRSHGLTLAKSWTHVGPSPPSG